MIALAGNGLPNMQFCQDCSYGIPDPANSDACGDCGNIPVVTTTSTTTTTYTGPSTTTTTPPPPTPCVAGQSCTQGVPTPPVDRCNNPQNRAPQPAPQTTLTPKAGATDFERLLHMSILFYEAQGGFRGPFKSF